jgi:methionyl aminopeptidase
MHGDLNATFAVGELSLEAADLVSRTQEALNRGIKAVAPGREINVIGRAIESYAKRFGYGVVRDYTGHGVGTAFHSGLVIPHYDASPDYDTVMVPGMVFTIEPMLTLGTLEHPGTTEWDEWSDDWTVVTRDLSLTAQFEHTLVVTERGADILTLH